ncbi:ABC transporter permease [Nocardioides sp. T2.26MG-1]|uniref:ABC transporter permease n=1 Tax=Nocardioides sp. T2.26MG-1 TaxID=3041166 RepID=UPI00247740D5|nr:ABC transporter permease [Nocardioides sp. T2.26MG-1]CAI9411360.1 hypothetical protein HIDPHFAB_01522 [Nocardioides sp. T2.26MG-1]
MSRLTSWRLALRLARREALRSRGRSVLAIAMIALPVLAVTAADVVISTQRVSAVESLDRRLGTTAAAQVVVPAEGQPVIQGVDPQAGHTSHGGRPEAAPTARDLAAALGDVRLLPERLGGVDLRTEDGVGYAEAFEVDLADPLAAGLVRLTSGRLPDDDGEVVVNQEVLDKGYAVGDRVELTGRHAPSPVIVGVVEDATWRTYPVLAGPLGSLGLDGPGYAPTWLVGGGPVDWDAVRDLNALGATVYSRAVVEHPPPASAIPAEIRSWQSDGPAEDVVAAAVLIVVMALLEVVLLAGPAFAVGARRQARSLALMAASGGTPAQSRRVVLGSGVVLGGAAAVIGIVLGIGSGIALAPVVQRWSSTWFGPLEIPWTHLLGIAGFGLLSALLAALVPAWIASRQDIVAVLAGRRADRPPSRRSPVLGVVLLGAGVAASAYGATAGRDGAYFIAASAVIAVLGMILLVPVVVVAVAWAAGRLPLSARYAARDAARHRTRTVPAVAAVAATVAGVVSLGIAVSSDEAQNAGTYTPMLPMGAATVTDYRTKADWPALRDALDAIVPSATVTELSGMVEATDDGGYMELTVRRDGEQVPLAVAGGALGTPVLVDAGAGIGALSMLSEADAAAARRTLAAGGAVVFTNDDADGAGEVRMTARVHPGPKQPAEPPRSATLAALLVHVDERDIAPRAVVSPALAERLGLQTRTVSLLVTGADISDRQATALGEAVTAVDQHAGFYVERGYQADDSTVILQLVLGALGAVLMLGGTLTATFLALSDARPDLATLSAVGASPWRRRAIAAAYALVVGLVGAVLGAAVGFIPGIAVSYPLTAPDFGGPGPFLDIPWLLVGSLVLGLPLLTAAIVGLTARSRLPLVSRLD